MKIPKAIAKARKRARLTQVELAGRLGVAASTVAGWELGTHGPRSVRLTKLARALGVTVAELVA